MTTAASIQFPTPEQIDGSWDWDKIQRRGR